MPPDAGAPVAGAGARTRVVCLLDSLVEIGGAESLALEMVCSLDAERYEATLVLTRWSDAVAAREPALSALARVEAAGVRVVGLPRRSRLSLLPWARLHRFLRGERIDVLHAHKFGSNMWGTIFGRLARVPVVIAHEHMWSYRTDARGRGRGMIDRKIARHADAFIAVSEEGRRQMVEVQGIDPGEVVYIPNGMPVRPAGDPARARRELGISPDVPVVGTLANLRPEKALEVLVEAAAIARESHPGLRVLVAGEGGERASLERLIRERSLGGCVDLLGYRSDVGDLLAAFDVAVCCSDYEGGPLSVMEYMAAGLGIVATRVGGLPELLGDGARFVEPRDPEALAGAIGELIDDAALRARLGEAARSRREEHYGIDRWVRRIERLYDDLLAAKRSQTSR